MGLFDKPSVAGNSVITKMIQQYGYKTVDGHTTSDVYLAANLFDHIMGEFPGYQWTVCVQGALVTVMNETLSNNWGFRVKTSLLDSDGKVIRRFAAGLLERYGLRANGMKPEEIRDLPTDFQGNILRVA